MPVRDENLLQMRPVVVVCLAAHMLILVERVWKMLLRKNRTVAEWKMA